MPTYEYQCSHCGQTTEIFQSITEPPRRKCPHCGKMKLKRLLGTGAGVIFKGSGFYQTDYRSDSYKKESAKESGQPQTQRTAGGAATSATPSSSAGSSSTGKTKTDAVSA